ncbi:membrane protein [Chitinophaga skermanii]|uniref:Membrane protein n=1 Tax=Chitinophaga skermanii TaxID=331697 RepID=A0A327QLX9_9BACT|nr:YihY/virulence factor BrkB family protein [Chitinophaga skermanii]RAJ05261.1 membrane protein [Chitinophaga skermanii]
MINIERTVRTSRPFRRIVDKSKSWILPGFEGAVLYDVVKFFLQEIKTRSLTDRAAAISFNFLLAIPPFFIFLFTLVPFIPLQNIEPTLYDLAKSLTPNYSSYLVVREMIHDFLYTHRNGLLSIAFLIGFYYSSNGVMGILRSFEKMLPGFKKRTWWQNRLTAFKLTSLLVLLVLITLILTITQGSILTWILEKLHITDNITRVMIGAVRWAIIVALFFFIISFIYRFGPATTKKWKYITPGAVVAAVSMIVVTLGFSFYVTNFGNYNKIYGSIGTILVLMLYIYLNSFILLIGFELNTSIGALKEIARARALEASLQETENNVK